MEPRLVRPLRIVVIEDDDAIRTALVQILRARGHAVLALARWEARDGAPRADVWLVDYSLPGRNGAAIVRSLVTARGRAATPLVIGVSADDGAELEFADAGADAFVRKPFSIEALSLLVDRGPELRAWS